MFASTKIIDPVLSNGNYHYGLGYWTDEQEDQIYFYVSIPTFPRHGKHYSTIFRLDINQHLSTWELVGKVDFVCRSATLTQCGTCFWSVVIDHNERINGFWRVNLKTLHCEEFEAIG